VGRYFKKRSNYIDQFLQPPASMENSCLGPEADVKPDMTLHDLRHAAIERSAATAIN
jgi:hypothetical protein